MLRDTGPKVQIGLRVKLCNKIRAWSLWHKIIAGNWLHLLGWTTSWHQVAQKKWSRWQRLLNSTREDIKIWRRCKRSGRANSYRAYQLITRERGLDPSVKDVVGTRSEDVECSQSEDKRPGRARLWGGLHGRYGSQVAYLYLNGVWAVHFSSADIGRGGFPFGRGHLFCFSQVPWKPLRVVHAGLRVG